MERPARARIPRHAIAVLGLGLLAVLATPAEAELIGLEAWMDGPQAGTTSAVTGFGVLMLDTDTNVITWLLTWDDTPSPVVDVHLHGPALPGQEALLQFDLGELVGLGNPNVGWAIVDDPQELQILNDWFYFMLHTEEYRFGEIRGQLYVVPEPTGPTLLRCGLVALVALACRRGRRRSDGSWRARAATLARTGP